MAAKRSKKPKPRGRAAAKRSPAKRSAPATRRAPPGDAPVAAPSGPSETSRTIAISAAEAGLDKKAMGVEIVDVTGKVDYADFLVLMTGQSDRHVAAIAEAVDDALSRAGHPPISVEGLQAAQWVLLDVVDVVVHVFHGETRAVYDLDGLWMDARRVPVPDRAP